MGPDWLFVSWVTPVTLVTEEQQQQLFSCLEVIEVIEVIEVMRCCCTNHETFDVERPHRARATDVLPRAKRPTLSQPAAH